MANDVILLDQRQRDDQGAGYAPGGYAPAGTGTSGAPDSDLEDLPF